MSNWDSPVLIICEHYSMFSNVCIGAVTAMQRCLLEVPGVLCKEMNDSMFEKILSLMENITVLMLGVLYGDPDTESKGKHESSHLIWLHKHRFPSSSFILLDVTKYLSHL